MSKSRHVSPRSVYIILGLSLFVALGYSLWNLYLRPLPAPASIDVISSLSYGPVELDGVIQKDAPLGAKGEYILVVSSSNILVLDQQGLDPLVGVRVHVTGTMIPQTVSSGGKNILQLSSLEVLP